MNAIDYQKQASEFLKRNGIKFRATLSDSKVAPWSASSDPRHRHHYRITLSKRGQKLGKYGHVFKNRLTFDFWGSIADCEAGKTEITAYDVLACIPSAVNCPDTFEDYCSEYGESEDSIRALQSFRRCSRFAKRLRDFFTAEEVEQLQEIQ